MAARQVASVAARGLSLSSMLDSDEALDPRDRALQRAIVSGTLRWHHRLSWQAEQLLTRKLASGEAQLAALIRIGLFQLQWLRIPDHAVVAETVAASALIGRRHAKGLVNAVLRRFIRERDELDARMLAVPSARWSHPQWLIDLISSDWGPRAVEIFDANNSLPPMWLRVNLRRGTRAKYLETLSKAGISATADTMLPAAVLVDSPVSMNELPGFAAGLVSIQDAAAQYAAPLLAPLRGHRLLDACAAPGGKAAHLLESYPDLKELVAVDLDADRLDVVGQELRRLGHSATLVNADAANPGSWWDGRPFDRILLDAPCTATGVIRRHPDIKLLRRREDVESCAQVQAQLLGALWPMLSSGGRLLYATCSVLKDENERQIARFLSATSNARLVSSQTPPAGQTFPGEANRDGFYYACIERNDGP